MVVDALLFIENRELLDPRRPRLNPAIEWSRLARAVADLALNQVDPSHPAPGGSTLATQIEKFRHSPEGRTESIREKLRQVASASLRAYVDGEETLTRRRQIVADYLDSVPLAARPGIGEINGLGDGLWAWYGRMRSANPTFLRPRDGSQWHACEDAGQFGRRIRGSGGLSSSAAMSTVAAGCQFHGSIASRSFMRAVGSRSRMSVR